MGKRVTAVDMAFSPHAPFFFAALDEGLDASRLVPNKDTEGARGLIRFRVRAVRELPVPKLPGFWASFQGFEAVESSLWRQLRHWRHLVAHFHLSTKEID